MYACKGKGSVIRGWHANMQHTIGRVHIHNCWQGRGEQHAQLRDECGATSGGITMTRFRVWQYTHMQTCVSVPTREAELVAGSHRLFSLLIISICLCPWLTDCDSNI